MGVVTYIQRDRSKAPGPNGTSWVHEESPSKTGETVPDKVCRKTDED